MLAGAADEHDCRALTRNRVVDADSVGGCCSHAESIRRTGRANIARMGDQIAARLVAAAVQLGPAAHAEFAQGTGNVIHDNAGANTKPGRYLRVSETGSDEVGHAAFRRGKALPAERRPTARASPAPGHNGGLLDTEPGTAIPDGAGLLAERPGSL